MSVTRRHIMTQDESLVDKAECLISLVNAAWPESVRGSLAAPRTWAGSIHTELLSGPSHELLQHELMDRFGFNQGNYFEAWIPPVGSKAREQRDFSTPPHSPHSVSLSHAPSLFGKAQSRRRPLQAQRQVANESRKRSRHKQWPFLFMAVSNSNSKLIIHTQSPTANIQKRLHM